MRVRDKLVKAGLWDAEDQRDPEKDVGAAWEVAERLRKTMDLCVEVRLHGRRFAGNGCRVRIFDYSLELYEVEGNSAASAICHICELASHYSGWETTTR